jgi:hypothetical protein
VAGLFDVLGLVIVGIVVELLTNPSILSFLGRKRTGFIGSVIFGYGRKSYLGLFSLQLSLHQAICFNYI